VTTLADRVAVVTGTSSGLGRRFAEVLDRAGARVVLASRRHEKDLELAAQLRDAFPVACDVRVAADREALLAAALDRYGRIDLLVNNAGVAYSGPAEQETPEHLRNLIDTNLTGLFALTQLVGRHMLDRGSGVIINIASPSAVVSLDRYGLAGYAATKAGVVALTRELARNGEAGVCGSTPSHRRSFPPRRPGGCRIPIRSPGSAPTRRSAAHPEPTNSTAR